MADLTGSPIFKDTIRGLEPSDAIEPTTFNPPYQDLLNNTKYLKDQADAHLADNAYQIPTIVGTQIQITRQSDTKRLYFYNPSDLSGGNITISLDAGVSDAPLKDYDGNTYTELPKGYQEVVDNTTFFTLRPRGASGGLWLYDLSAYTTVADWDNSVSIPATSWGTILDTVSGEGFLTFCAVSANFPAASTPKIKVTVDGTSFEFDGDLSASAYIDNLITEPIYFKESIKVEAYNANSGASTLYSNISYLIKNANPDFKKQTLLEQANRKQAFNNTTSTSYVDVVNISGSGYFFLSITSWYVNSSGSSNVSLKVVLDGVTILNDYLVGGTGTTTLRNIFKGPLKFETSLQIQQKVAASTCAARSLVEYTTN